MGVWAILAMEAVAWLCGYLHASANAEARTRRGGTDDGHRG